MEYPETLYVKEEIAYEYGYSNPPITRLVGTEILETRVPDNGGETAIAIYRLVRIEKYKKAVTRIEVIEKI